MRRINLTLSKAQRQRQRRNLLNFDCNALAANAACDRLRLTADGCSSSYSSRRTARIAMIRVAISANIVVIPIEA